MQKNKGNLILFMNIPDKTLCGWKNADRKAKTILQVIDPPKYFCKDCGRIANKKKWLCEPKKLYKEKKS